MGTRSGADLHDAKKAPQFALPGVSWSPSRGTGGHVPFLSRPRAKSSPQSDGTGRGVGTEQQRGIDHGSGQEEPSKSRQGLGRREDHTPGLRRPEVSVLAQERGDAARDMRRGHVRAAGGNSGATVVQRGGGYA